MAAGLAASLGICLNISHLFQSSFSVNGIKVFNPDEGLPILLPFVGFDNTNQILVCWLEVRARGPSSPSFRSYFCSHLVTWDQACLVEIPWPSSYTLRSYSIASTAKAQLCFWALTSLWSTLQDSGVVLPYTKGANRSGIVKYAPHIPLFRRGPMHCHRLECSSLGSLQITNQWHVLPLTWLTGIISILSPNIFSPTHSRTINLTLS